MIMQAVSPGVSPSYSFINDDRGITGPYTDIPAIGIIAIGILLFGYLMQASYSSYASSAYRSAVIEDLKTIADAVASDPAITYEGYHGLLDAGKIDAASYRQEILYRYGHPGSTVAITIRTGDHTWDLGERRHGRSAGYSIPVAVVLNDARCVHGILTVTMWEGR